MRRHEPLKLHTSDAAFDLFHHPHKADGAGIPVGIVLSPPSQLTDPDKPDGVAQTLHGLSCRMRDTV
jgi:hypothetical protein